MGRPPKCNPCCRGFSPEIEVLACVYGADQLSLLNPDTGAILATHTIPDAGLGSYRHVFVRDSLAYCGGSDGLRIKYVTYGGSVSQMTGAGCNGNANPWGELQLSTHALPSGTELLTTWGDPAVRYSYTGLGTGTLEATYTMPATASHSLDQCTGIQEDGAGDIICGYYYRSSSNVWCAGFDRDPGTGTDVTKNWSYPGGSGGGVECNSLARLRFDSAATFAAAIQPSSVLTTISILTPSITAFSATGSAFGSIVGNIRLHSSPYSDHWNEVGGTSTREKHIAGVAVTHVPDEEGELYATSQPALDSGTTYSAWRLTESGTLVWRYADTGSQQPAGRLSTDPDTGDLFCGWYDTSGSTSHGIRRHRKSDGVELWSTTLHSGSLGGGFVPNTVSDSARGRMATA